MANGNPCCCDDKTVCMTFGQSAARYNDMSAHAAATALSIQNNLQASFNTQAQQQLESTNSSRLADALVQMAAAMNSGGGGA